MSPVIRKRLTPAALADEPGSLDSLQQAARDETQGVYTVCNTQRGGRVFRLDAHLDRLEESAGRQGVTVHLPRQRIRQALRSMLDESGFDEMRFRLSVPRQAPDQLLIAIEPWRPPANHLRRDGLRCAIAAGLARRDPAAKDSAWLQQRSRFRMPPGCHEALLTGAEGAILEGLGSNFYAVAAGELRTAAGGAVLAGITRGIVLQLAPAILPVNLSAPRLEEIARFDEAFISSSSRGLLPVVQIDDQVIGDGRPGPLTHALDQAFDAFVQRHLEAL